MQFQRFSLALCVWAIISTACAAATAEAPDLNPVTFKKIPSHQPIKIVENGKPLANICIMTGKNRAMRRVAREMQKSIEMTTGAKLPILWEKLEAPAIVLGDCPAAKKAGLAGEKMPIEGFAIKTASDRIHIVGNGDGTSWGAYEFLERYVGVRWYWPDYRDEFGRSGVSVIKTKTITVPPVNLYDAPAFRKRTRWPSGGPRIGEAVMSAHDHRLRCGNSWPIDLIVHAPHNWARQYKESRPEIFQLRKDGKRDYSMLCYGHPHTLETYLEEIEYQRKKLKAGERLAQGRRIIKGKAITVSPADIAVSCRCKHCRKLWDKNGGHYGTASKILGSFVAELGRHVKKQWPDMTVIFLTYKNYTLAPEGVEFPDNVQIQICGMPGLAQYKDKVIRARMQQNVDDWVRLTGNKIQNWHYSCWPANRTKAAYLFPHTIKSYYQDNLDKTVGTFINGVKDHWPRQHLSLYVWLKVLWDPDVDVDAIVEQYCERMYGPASETMRELVGMLIDGWENTEWSPHVLSPKTIYEQSYPRQDVLKIKQLLETAYKEAEGNKLVTRRLDYYSPHLRAFFAESKLVTEGEGIKPLKVYQAAENPTIDGKLDEKAWENVPAGHFVKVKGKTKPEFPTQVRGVWTRDGITFGFRMTEPDMENLKHDIGKDSRDASLIWWNDNVEIFLDPSGQRKGYYQFIVNANGALYDSIGREDTSWDPRGVKTGTQIGKNHWTVEIYIPYAIFKDGVRPATGVEWHGNFTRHRVTDRKNREYQGYNVTKGAPSHNQNSFGPIKFIER